MPAVTVPHRSSWGLWALVLPVALLAGCRPVPATAIEPIDSVLVALSPKARLLLDGPSPRVYPRRRCRPDTIGMAVPGRAEANEAHLPVRRKVPVDVPVTVAFTFPRRTASEPGGEQPACAVAGYFWPRAGGRYEWSAYRVSAKRCDARVHQLRWLNGREHREPIAMRPAPLCTVALANEPNIYP